MATNKHATIRYHALDRCFGNIGRKFFIEDLIEACNKAIYDFTGSTNGIKRRQVFDDIKFMESEEGWSIDLERVKEGKRVYYRYTDPNFSIKNKGLNQSEAEQIESTLSILSRFKGLPHFEWIEEMLARVQETFHLKGDHTAKISFDENPYLKGLNYFSDLYKAINDQKVIEVQYQGFNQTIPSNITFHPWYLKQFNNRWFVFGFNENFESLSNLAIDRIITISNSEKRFKPNNEIDFEDYFEDIVGVTVFPDKETQKIKLKINNKLWPYIESKPIHGSQTKRNQTSEGVIIQLEVQINHEFMSLLFSYMDGIEILEPKGLRDQFLSIANNIRNKNN